MKKQILSLFVLVLVGIFIVGCTRGGVEEAAAESPDEGMVDDTVVNDMENNTVTGNVESTGTVDDTATSGDTTTETGTQDTTGTVY